MLINFLRVLFSNQKSCFTFILFLFAVFLTACEEEGSSSSKKASMCYEFGHDGVNNTLILNCYSSGSSCSDDGKSTLATYKDWDTCWNDTDAVLNAWAANGGSPKPGPNSIEAGSGAGGSGGGTLNCSNTWTGHPDDHARFNCQAACVEYNAGNDAGVDANCGILSGYGSAAVNACTVC